MQGYLTVEQVGMTFGTKDSRFTALADVSLSIQKGEFISIIGHSGCGKSTLLNIVAGLLKPSTGAVLLDDAVVDAPGPDRAVVFQSHSLLPWLTAYSNVRLAVDKIFGNSKTARERDDWTRHNLRLVKMEQAMTKKPDELSGGMRQRVGIARALAMQPKMLLLDEPFGALDALTRAHLQDTVMDIHQAARSTAIMITHDVDEAVLLSDRIVMMTNGPGATIGDICPVKLERPRQRLAMADSAEYIRCRKQVLQFLYERHARAA